jgi:hypothetical protein
LVIIISACRFWCHIRGDNLEILRFEFFIIIEPPDTSLFVGFFYFFSFFADGFKVGFDFGMCFSDSHVTDHRGDIFLSKS